MKDKLLDEKHRNVSAVEDIRTDVLILFLR